MPEEGRLRLIVHIFGFFAMGHHPPQPAINSLLLVLFNLVLELAKLLLRAGIRNVMLAMLLDLHQMVVERVIV